ncbi:MAG: holo-ACP synthase [Alphaproteobacteria bacterium]|tara:strand:- start:240 stop:617 length:378 start_codon:yes stop_codon:yes gene_type:complete
MKILQGIDLLKIERIKKIYLSYGNRFLKKILTDKEIKELKNSKQISSKIAGKFSAKEAASKALGTGFADGVKHKDIEILNLESGKPIINLHANAKQKLNHIQSSSISISNEDGFVVTIVTFLVKN